MQKLRTIVLACPLTEEMKWRVPVYTSEQRNIVFLGAFKELCAEFVKGALLRDPNSILRKPGENTQSFRLVRFTNIQEIVKVEPVLKAYIQEALAVEKAGLKVKKKKPSDYTVPEDFRADWTRPPRSRQPSLR